MNLKKKESNLVVKEEARVGSGNITPKGKKKKYDALIPLKKSFLLFKTKQSLLVNVQRRWLAVWRCQSLNSNASYSCDFKGCFVSHTYFCCWAKAHTFFGVRVQLWNVFNGTRSIKTDLVTYGNFSFYLLPQVDNLSDGFIDFLFEIIEIECLIFFPWLLGLENRTWTMKLTRSISLKGRWSCSVKL